jgi:hypothetical protein
MAAKQSSKAVADICGAVSAMSAQHDKAGRRHLFGVARPMATGGIAPVHLSFSRNREPRPSPAAARTALCLLVMVSTTEQVEVAERTLIWMAENRLPTGTYREALDELRLFAQASAEGGE